MALLMVMVSCDKLGHKFEHDNPLDPASDQHIPPQPGEARGVLVNDFDDNSTNLWGHTYDVFSPLRNASFTKRLITEETPDGRASLVMQLDYDVSANSNSQVIWYQVLGDTLPCCGPFNAQTMSLKNLSFFLRGSTGGESFEVTLIDVDGRRTARSVTTVVTAKNSWQKIPIPLVALAAAATGPVDLRKLESVNFSFYRGLVGPSDKGTVFIDKVMFEWE
jgi:hypothetical protein